jgi:hypothetical protein
VVGQAGTKFENFVDVADGGLESGFS